MIRRLLHRAVVRPLAVAYCLPAIVTCVAPLVACDTAKASADAISVASQALRSPSLTRAVAAALLRPDSLYHEYGMFEVLPAEFTMENRTCADFVAPREGKIMRYDMTQRAGLISLRDTAVQSGDSTGAQCVASPTAKALALPTSRAAAVAVGGDAFVSRRPDYSRGLIAAPLVTMLNVRLVRVALGEVTGIVHDPGSTEARADVTLRITFSAYGERMGWRADTIPKPLGLRATFRRYDDGWRVVRTEPVLR